MAEPLSGQDRGKLDWFALFPQLTEEPAECFVCKLDLGQTQISVCGFLWWLARDFCWSRHFRKTLTS